MMIFLQILLLVLALNTYEVFGVMGPGKTPSNDWNWVVGVEVDSQMYPGVLVTDQWVLTAKHIFDRVTLDRCTIWLYKKELPEGQGLKVKHLCHYDFDLALLHLESQVKVVPIFHPETMMPDKEAAAKCHVASWDVISAAKWKAVSVKVNLLDGDECNQITTSNHTFCAKASDKDTMFCPGDSGGPLFCEVNKEWVLFGVVSQGQSNCRPPIIPTIFSSVYNQLKWIKCQPE
ncbi:tryptase [Amia ocellicauda]|uniref:tryptase n=1 Tax=Amia ocellicauda TaxID=2972642 RepID=UPI003464BA55